jgi:hypothetical protein
MLSTLQRFSLPFRRAVVGEKEIAIRQAQGWVHLPKQEIAAVKAASVSKVIVRLYDGRRFEVSLFHFPLSTYTRLMTALQDALHENRMRRALWHGAKEI